jgi:monoterpene epsilon-lactone hydrolase
MSAQQKIDVIEAIRAAAAAAPPATTVDEQRAQFAAGMSLRRVGDDVVATDVVVGGVPALDVRTSAGDGDGVLLYLHGGGYVVGSPRTHLALTSNLARAAATRLVSLDYRLAPEHPFPAAVDDARSAYDAIVAGGVPPEHVVIAGDSAGGGLALALLVSLRDAGGPIPAGAVLLSPWTDLTGTAGSLVSKADADPMLSRDMLRLLADAYTADDTALLASPGRADLHGLPPLLVQVGSAEVLLDDSLELAARAAHADVDVTLEVVSGVPHVFPSQADALDEASDAVERAGAFVRSRIGAASPV